MIGANVNDQTFPKSMEYPHYNGGNDSNVDRHSSVQSVNDTITETLKRADLLVVEKQEALKKANRNEESLLLECEKMRDDYEKLKRLHSVNLTFHREHIDKLKGDMQSMTVVCNGLQQQLRVLNLKKNLQKKSMKNTYRLQTNAL